jgi:hypothetical protein
VFNELNTIDPATSEFLPSSLSCFTNIYPSLSKMVFHLRQFFAGPFFHQTLGISVGPIRVCLADALLVFAVGGRSTPKRAGEVVSEN